MPSRADRHSVRFRQSADEIGVPCGLDDPQMLRLPGPVVRPELMGRLDRIENTLEKLAREQPRDYEALSKYEVTNG